jgi:tetratricopeptide (TPR) repeat protein
VARPGLPLSAVARRLADTGDGLDALRAADDAADVRTVLSWSYRALSDPAARLFRLLGLLPVPEATPAALASLAGTPVRRARAAIDELVDAHLLAERTPGRYGLHDLLYAYARELPGRADAATRRLVDHYLRTAYAADRLVFPHRDPVCLPASLAGVTPAGLADRGEALGWLAAERPAVVATVRLAVRSGLDGHAWRLAWAALDYFDRWGHWNDQVTTQEAALGAADRLGDGRGRAHAHRGVGRAYGRTGRLDEAAVHLRRAAELFGELGSPAGQARTELSLAVLAERQSDHARALCHAERALELFRLAGRPIGEGNALNTVGWYHALLGRPDRAVACCEAALTLLREHGDGYGEAATWDSLGYAHHGLGRYDEARRCYTAALALYGRTGDRYSEAGALDRLAATCRASGDPAGARAAWRRAQAILTELDDPDARRVADQLRDLDGQPPGSAGAPAQRSA